MKTIKTITAAFVTGAILLTACGGAESDSQSEVKEVEVTTDKKEVDLEKSIIAWKGEMLGVYSHTGTLKLKSANILIEKGVVTGGKFTVDMTTMVATDENYNPQEDHTKEKLIGHLSSPDFFDVATYPEASYEIKEVNGSVAEGTLSLKDVSGPQQVKNIIVSGNEISGTVTVNRKNFNVVWDHPVKEEVLSDDLEITVKLVLK